MTNYQKLLIRKWGSDDEYLEFPYSLSNGENGLPEFDVSTNDLDKDSYTNTKGKTIRNRIRKDVASLDFNVSEMDGDELHKFYQITNDTWFEAIFFYEPEWKFVSKKVYRSGTVKFHKYYIHPTDPNKNIYTNVQFSFIEQ